MYHYAYILTFPNNMKYIGARSFRLKPDLDTTYLGSGRYLPKDRHDNRHCVQKEIIKCFNTREELVNFEKSFIIENQCVESSDWYNARKSTYDRYGTKTLNRAKPTEPYKSGITFKRRYGQGYRTPAQIDGAKRMREKLTGVANPLKAHHGIDNSGFTAWYYINPLGVYVEVHDKTKQEMAEELGFTARQLGHGFHYTNEHKCSNRLPRKGWTFGNLPRPT